MLEQQSVYTPSNGHKSKRRFLLFGHNSTHMTSNIARASAVVFFK
jgi:hypothetical protein